MNTPTEPETPDHATEWPDPQAEPDDAGAGHPDTTPDDDDDAD